MSNENRNTKTGFFLEFTDNRSFKEANDRSEINPIAVEIFPVFTGKLGTNSGNFFDSSTNPTFQKKKYFIPEKLNIKCTIPQARSQIQNQKK